MKHGKEISLRIIGLLLPALYCSWRALFASLYKHDELRDINLDHSIKSTMHDEGNTSSCFSLNSREWLEGPRHGNTIHLEDEFAKQLILFPTTQFALRQSICDKNSPLLELHDDMDSPDREERHVRLWTVRLLYLAVHDHQHRPARLETTTHRHSANCESKYRLGNFDYECQSAKFLIVSFYKNGIGANLRLAAVPALMAGLSTGRVVLFVDHAVTGPAFLREPWTLASCDRRDSQCFFLPASPCVLTQAEIANAYQLQRAEMRSMFRHGKVPGERAKDRVLIVHLNFRPQRQPNNLRHVLYNMSTTLIEPIVASFPPSKQTSLTKTLLKAATQILTEPDQNSTTYKYYGGGSPIFQSLLLYAMRPNPNAATRLHTIIEETIPRDFVSANSLGLPIRGMYDFL
jgi:hypothetical protein